MLKSKTNVSFVIVIIWAISIEKDNEEHLIGLWTDFNGQVTEEANVMNRFLQYLPTIPQSLEFLVCKRFLDELLKVMRDLDLDHIFAHDDNTFMLD